MEMNRCEICFDPPENCSHVCKGLDCKSYETCHRRISPVIRITKKCTQKCDHCCFSCSPNEDEMMTIKTASKIKKFYESNNILSMNIMGGEFFCNYDWEDVCEELVSTKDLMYVRITSNGDWAGSDKTAKKVIDFCKRNPVVYVAVSKDKWHTNRHVDKAVELLYDNKISMVGGKGENNEDDSIVPVGNGQFIYGFYSSFGCMCHKPDCKYKMMIDEDGEIYKCPMGIWEFDNVDNFQKGGFAPRFKEFYGKFESVFMGNCSCCLRGYERYGSKARKNAKVKVK